MSTLKVDAIRHNSATSDAITTASDGTCTAKVSNTRFSNIIVNGGMLISQRGSSFAVADGSEKYTLDRYYMDFGGGFAGGCTITQDSDSPSGFANSLKLDVTTANTSIGASHHNHLIYRIEGQDLLNSGWDHTSSSSYITCSFWAKSVKAGTYYLAARTAPGTDYTWFKGYTLAANTWKKVTISIPGNSNITINDDNAKGMDLRWVFGLGSSKVGTAETWSTNLYYGASDQANLFDSTSNNFWLTGVQLVASGYQDYAPDFEHRSYGEELARCQRYYYFHVGGPNTFSSASTEPVICLFHMWNTGSAFGYIDFPVSMRTSPSADFNLGTDRVKCQSAGTEDFCNVITINGGQTHPNATRPYIYGDLNYTAGNAGLAFLNNNDAYVAFTAEL